jgi:hypothetical protein
VIAALPQLDRAPNLDASAVRDFRQAIGAQLDKQLDTVRGAIAQDPLPERIDDQILRLKELVRFTSEPVIAECAARRPAVALLDLRLDARTRDVTENLEELRTEFAAIDPNALTDVDAPYHGMLAFILSRDPFESSNEQSSVRTRVEKLYQLHADFNEQLDGRKPAAWEQGQIASTLARLDEAVDPHWLSDTNDSSLRDLLADNEDSKWHNDARNPVRLAYRIGQDDRKKR